MENSILDVINSNGYTKHFYGYRKITDNYVHWITLYSEAIQMYGYLNIEEDADKSYDTGIINVDNEQLKQLINIWSLNYK